MLSILIPVFNHSITELVTELADQASQIKVAIDIICLDDGSDDRWKVVNREIRKIGICHYEELPDNVGRSKIRNLLAAQATQPYLLFLDGDSSVGRKDFLTTYLASIEPDQVLVGGRSYPDLSQIKQQRLHWRAGRYREQRLTSGFQSSNFLIPTEKFQAIGGFDEIMTGYGHEDTLLGFRLDQQGIAIRHIVNPVLHNDLKSATDFMDDQEEALRNLFRIKMRFPELQTNLLRSILTLETWGLAPIVSLLFRCGGRQLRAMLTGSFPNLPLLDLYKIGFYLNLER